MFSRPRAPSPFALFALLSTQACVGEAGSIDETDALYDDEDGVSDDELVDQSAPASVRSYVCTGLAESGSMYTFEIEGVGTANARNIRFKRTGSLSGSEPMLLQTKVAASVFGQNSATASLLFSNVQLSGILQVPAAIFSSERTLTTQGGSPASSIGYFRSTDGTTTIGLNCNTSPIGSVTLHSNVARNLIRLLESRGYANTAPRTGTAEEIARMKLASPDWHSVSIGGIRNQNLEGSTFIQCQQWPAHEVAKNGLFRTTWEARGAGAACTLMAPEFQATKTRTGYRYENVIRGAFAAQIASASSKLGSPTRLTDFGLSAVSPAGNYVGMDIVTNPSSKESWGFVCTRGAAAASAECRFVHTQD